MDRDILQSYDLTPTLSARVLAVLRDRPDWQTPLSVAYQLHLGWSPLQVEDACLRAVQAGTAEIRYGHGGDIAARYYRAKLPITDRPDSPHRRRGKSVLSRMMAALAERRPKRPPDVSFVSIDEADAFLAASPARVREPTEYELHIWEEWKATRPAHVREVADRLDPWTLHRMRDTGQRVLVWKLTEHITFGDGPTTVTATVAVLGEFNYVFENRNVFGVDPDDLELCDPPEEGELVGVGVPVPYRGASRP